MYRVAGLLHRLVISTGQGRRAVRHGRSRSAPFVSPNKALQPTPLNVGAGYAGYASYAPYGAAELGRSAAMTERVQLQQPPLPTVITNDSRTHNTFSKCFRLCRFER
jgi:hypothetical protein